MSQCNNPPPTKQPCNCCNESAVQDALSALQDKIAVLESKIADQEATINRLPPVPRFSSCDGQILAVNASIAECADIDRIEEALENQRNALWYRLKDCSGVELAHGDRIASCGDLSVLAGRLDIFISQITNFGEEVNRVREIAESAKQTVERAALHSNIDESTLRGITDRLTAVENRLTEVSTTATSAAAGVDAINAGPKP